MYENPKRQEWFSAGAFTHKVNGEIDQSLQKYVEVARWGAAAGRVKGNTPEVRQLNSYLDALKAKAMKMEREMVQDRQVITVDSFREKWFGVQERPRMLLEIFQEHNDEVYALIGKEFAQATLTRFNSSKDHVATFLQWKYQISDIDINRLNFEFVSDYEFWLKTKKNCGHNTTLKYIADLRKVLNNCIRKGWLVRDPFLGFKMTRHEVDKDFLSEDELQTIFSKDFETDRLNQVRDVFIFSCYTGLAWLVIMLINNEICCRVR